VQIVPQNPSALRLSACGVTRKICSKALQYFDKMCVRYAEFGHALRDKKAENGSVNSRRIGRWVAERTSHPNTVEMFREFQDLYLLVKFTFCQCGEFERHRKTDSVSDQPA